ncbi:MAG TPA: gliding motility-associated C-terminal domain-containing protein, partial [Bacteroidia bacterium]|nr:gliding motility-associated C-terminal domain-containing protein [Bacteroidia bacterium]
TTQQTCGSNVVLNSASGSAYQWYDTSNVIIAGATAQTYSVSSATNGQHYIVAYSDNTTGCRDSVEIDISKYNLNFSYLSSNPCNGGTNGSINVTPSGTYTFSSYNWDLSGALTASGTSTTTPISVPNLGGGTYTVDVYPTGNPSCLFTYTVQLTPGNIPPPVLDTVKACNLDTVNLNPPVPAGYTNNWYTATPFGALGTSAANVAYPIYPMQQAGASYIDTIKSPAGCVSVYKVSLKIQSFQKTISVVQQLKCYNDSIGKIKVVVPRETNGPIGHPYTFNWVYPSPYTSPATVTTGSTVAVSSTEGNLHPGFYYCIIKSGNCTDTAKITLTNPPKLSADSIYAYYCPKDSLALVIADSGQSNYVWHPSNAGATGTGDSAYVPVQSLNNFYVTYLRNGCPDTGKIIISTNVYNAFRPDELVNVFSPNGDKTNDFFYPFYSKTLNQYQIYKQSDSYQLYIYDRWGKLVFETTDYDTPWDGKTKSGHNADAGSYFFIVKYKSNCASKADLVEKKGFVELMR